MERIEVGHRETKDSQKQEARHYPHVTTSQCASEEAGSIRTCMRRILEIEIEMVRVCGLERLVPSHSENCLRQASERGYRLAGPTSNRVAGITERYTEALEYGDW
jgi:hypothetical protein